MPFRVNTDEISERLSQLEKKKKSKPYEKQKSALHREFTTFLASLPTPKSLASATSHDIVSFLVWKDKTGRTKVHQADCSQATVDTPTCECPTRLAAGTIDSLIGKLRSIFTQAERGGSWNYELGTGNPASHHCVTDYLRIIKEEQAQARVRPKKAVPLFMNKLEKLTSHILSKLQTGENSPITLYILSRDLCFFCLDFFSGDRAADLSLTLSREVLFFPDKTGLLFNHTFGKTLRGDALNTFAIRRCSNLLVCPVTNFERYLSICRLTNIDLRTGYLFRNTRGNSVCEAPFSSSAVRNRLKGYLETIGIDNGETPHSLRSGCAITLALLGVPHKSIAQHIGWSSTNMLDHYSDLREALRPDAPAAALAASATRTSIGEVSSAYKALDDVSNFSPAII